MPIKTQAPTYRRKAQALRETVDLRLWLKRCKEAGIPTIGATVCPFELNIEEVIGIPVSPVPPTASRILMS